MTRALTALYPAPRYVAVALLTLGVGMGVYGVLRARARMDTAAMERKWCAAELRALRQATLFIERYVVPSEPCLALQIVAGEGK